MKKFFIPFFLLISSFLAADEVTVQNKQGNYIQTLIMILIALVFFYFILWRPEQKRRKKTQKQRNEMKKGDRVTAMGLVGTISQIKDQTVILKMVEGAKIEVLKAAISDVQPESSSEEVKDLATEKK